MSSTQPIIGLAGGIGSGKSTVAEAMAQQGAQVVDADRLAQEALDRPEVIEQLTAWWGTGILDSRGRPDRKRLAELVFEQDDQREKLEGLIHPIVKTRIQKQIDQARADPSVRAIVLDVPLLFEAGLSEKCDRIVFVESEPAQRLNRVRKRGWDGEALQNREKKQWSLDRKQALAHDIIRNTTSEADCRKQARQVLERIVNTP